MKHLAIFTEESIKDIFANKKTIDTRFSLKRIAPFQKIKAGDLVYMKKSGGEIMGQFLANCVISFDNLNPSLIGKIKRDYNKEIQASKSFWTEKQEAKYGTLIFISQVQPVLFPLFIPKKDRRPWMVLE